MAAEKDKGTATKERRKVFVPSPGRLTRGGMRIVCPECGNDQNFFEVANDVSITTRYVQNSDGSFTPQSHESTILGDIRLYCGECYADLSQYYQRFAEMIF
jgi:hypothetical protein